MEVEETPSLSYFMKDDVDQEAAPKSLGMDPGCFDCNICLDFVAEPVVTLCGHLYCWPCIYRWLQQQDDSESQCPVCKYPLTLTALVPLYGRGHAPKPSHLDLKGIPRRPSVPRTGHHHDRDEGMSSILQHRQQQHRPYYNYPYVDRFSPPPSPRMVHSTIGGIAFAAMLGNQEGVYYPGTPRMMTGGGEGELSPRLRRQEMQLERLLHQIFLFFCFCVLLCLILF